MTFKMEEMPKSQIAYMRRVGPYGAGNAALMERFKKWVKANGLFTKSAVILGISQDNPETTPHERCRYDVCVIVPDGFEITDPAVYSAKLPGGNYAVFSVPHTAEAVRAAWSTVFLQLHSLGYPLDGSRPILERYIPELVENHLCELCLPV
jgi:DNA gyrase inhibitor GyrI